MGMLEISPGQEVGRAKKATVFLYGLFLVLVIYAGGAATALLWMRNHDNGVVEDYQARIKSLAGANKELRDLLRQDLPPMRDTMQHHTDQISALTDRVDGIAGKADGAAQTADGAARAAKEAARLAGQAGRNVGQAAVKVEQATERVQEVVEKITPAVPAAPATAPDWLN